jgi:nucleoside-diphosphate-sugar epimerase
MIETTAGIEITKIGIKEIGKGKEKQIIDLSTGTQERDYFFVEDLTKFLDKLLAKDVNKYKRELINIGSRIPRNLLEIANQLASKCPDYSDKLWNWGKLPQREGESKRFYNASSKCFELGFEITPLDLALNHTINHYWQNT